MKPRSVVAVVLPGFRVALVRARSPDLSPREPLGVVVHEEQDERSLSGGTRLGEVSDEARTLGVVPGATIASAKAKCADLRVRVLRPHEATRALESLAEMLIQFGPITSPLLDRDAVLVDVTGCAHLHGGDEALLSAITQAVLGAGFSCLAVLASGPEIAWALAHGSRACRAVPPNDAFHALGELSIDVLRLEPSTSSYFHKLGISTIAELRALPRAQLTARAGNANLLPGARAILDGQDDTPITRFQPHEILEERISLEYGIEHHEALFFVLKPLCDRLSARLEGRCALASRLEVVLELDRAMCDPGKNSEHVALPLASPVRKSPELLSVLRSRFEREPPFRAPVVAVVLRAPELLPVDARDRHLFEPESRAELALPKLAAELSALLGEQAIGTLAVVDDWRLGRRSKLQPFSSKTARRPEPHTPVSRALEPIRWVAPYVPPRDSFKIVAHLARFECIAWWREPEKTCDWKLIWSGDAMTFAEIDDNGHTRIRGYLD